MALGALNKDNNTVHTSKKTINYCSKSAVRLIMVATNMTFRKEQDTIGSGERPLADKKRAESEGNHINTDTANCCVLATSNSTSHDTLLQPRQR